MSDKKESHGKSNCQTKNTKLNHRIEWLQKQETGLGLKVFAQVKHLYKGKAQRQAKEFYSLFQIPAGIGRRRTVSYATEKSYLAITSRVLITLGEMNMPVQNLDEISAKQVRLLFRDYELKGTSASRMASVNTVLRRLGIWLGKPQLCPPLSTLLDNPNAGARSYTATIPKAWDACGVDPDAALSAISEVCEVTAAQTDLAMQFGVRPEEFVMFKPKEAIREKEQVLYVTDGTKGGKPRNIPIETDRQRQALERAKEIASRHPKGLMMAKQWQTLKQAREHMRYIMKKVGITKKQLGVTPHGLRHRYACTIYRLLTGQDAPVMGGGYVDPVVDSQARKEISKRLGHNRSWVTAAYLGNHRTLTRNKRRMLTLISTKLEEDTFLNDTAKTFAIFEFYIIGAAADGTPVARNQVMGFAYRTRQLEGESQADADDRVAGHANRMARHAGQLLDVNASCAPLCYFDSNIPTFEIYLGKGMNK